VRIIKKAYDEWDFPALLPDAPISSREEKKTKKKPGPKSKKPAPLWSSPVDKTPLSPTKPADSRMLIKKLVDGVREFFVKLDIREPKPKIKSPNAPVESYISNIVLDGQRIAYFEQAVGADRVVLRYEKNANIITIWHEGMDFSFIADKIKAEIEKNYTKKLAAKVGYKIAIKISAHRRRM